MTQLHILNGDATRTLFEQTTIPGDVFVWRDMLCSGPCSADVGSAAFFSMRDQFIQTEYGITEDHYQQKFINPFHEVAWNSYDEIILWFEYDLFCFINLIAATSFIKSKNLSSTLSLVDVSKEQLADRFVGLGEMSPSVYPNVFEARQQFDKKTTALAEQLWTIYCGENQAQFDQVLRIDNPIFPKLADVLSEHIKRLPTSKSIAQIDLDLLLFIKENQPTQREVIKQFLNQSDKLGYGDLQWEWQLKQLNGLYDISHDQLQLNSNGKTLLSQPTIDKDLLPLIKHIYDYRYGGHCLNKVFFLDS